MRYKILVPVTVNPDLVNDVFNHIQNKSNLIIVNNFDNQEVADLCQQAQKDEAFVYNYPNNLGLAASWNIGIRELEKEYNLDFVIILSSSAKFFKDIEEFAKRIDESEKIRKMGMYRSREARLHCFAITQLGLRVGGLFDENFYPIYYEDTDYYRRSNLNGMSKIAYDIPTDDLVISAGYGLSVNKEKRLLSHYQRNATMQVNYFTEKWGGLGSDAHFLTPFNNPNLDINYWVKREGTFNKLGK